MFFVVAIHLCDHELSTSPLYLIECVTHTDRLLLTVVWGEFTTMLTVVIPKKYSEMLTATVNLIMNCLGVVYI